MNSRWFYLPSAYNEVRMEPKTQPAKMQHGGRVSIDVEIRREFDLEEGDYVMITVRPMEEANE